MKNLFLWMNSFAFLGMNQVGIWKSMLQTGGLLILFVVIIGAAYYVTKWIGSVQYRKYKGSNIKVIESIGIAPQKVLQLVQVGDQIFLLGITKEQIVFLTEINTDSIDLEKGNSGQGTDTNFNSYLEKWMEHKRNKK